MSGFLGGDGTNVDSGFLSASDDRENAPWNRDWLNTFASYDQDPPWPRARLTGVDSDNTECWLEAVWFEPPSWPVSTGGLGLGTHVEYAFAGVTRDVNGNPLGGVTVMLFRTSDRQFITSTVSDPVGNYLIYSPYSPDTHFIVSYLAGTPDVTGATPNTLVGV